MLNFRVLVFVALTSCVYGCSIKKSSKNVGNVGETDILISEVPYMASLRSEGQLVCAGAIVHEHYILSAASCYQNWLNYNDQSQFTVTVGTDHHDNCGETYDVEKVIVHPDFTQAGYGYDLSLIKLTTDVNLGPTIAKVDLPTNETFQYEDDMVFDVTGWGQLDFSSDIENKYLRQTTATFVEECSCQDYYKELITLTDKMICVRESDAEECVNNIGGPLTLGNEILGVASINIGCNGHMPQVYTNLPVHMRWVFDVIARDE